MIGIYARSIASLVVLLCSTLLHAATYEGSLSAQFTGVEPAQPHAGVSFHAMVLAGPCEYLSEDAASATLVSNANGVVSVRVPGVLDISCNQDVAPRQFLLPGLPAGSYRLDLVLYMVEFPGDYGAPAGYIGGRDVQVLAPTSTSSIPTLGAPGGTVLVVLVLLMGARFFPDVRERFRSQSF